jgi:hypothetical protein
MLAELREGGAAAEPLEFDEGDIEISGSGESLMTPSWRHLADVLPTFSSWQFRFVSVI